MTSANETVEAPTRVEPARLEETPDAINDAVAALSSAGAVPGVHGLWSVSRGLVFPVAREPPGIQGLDGSRRYAASGR